MEVVSKWKVITLLTWFLIADIACSLPHVGNQVEATTTQSKTTDFATAFETQYPPSNEGSRLFIPHSDPVRLIDMCYTVSGMVLTTRTRCIE